jgi:hypothetical protein
MKQLICMAFVLFTVSACKKENQLSVIPKITFKEYIAYGIDSADCYISFEDGDGDIGSSQEPKKTNLRMLYLYKNEAGAFVPYDAVPGTLEFDTLYYDYTVPYATSEGQFKAIEGDILIKLRSAPLYNPIHKIVRFDITLWDRAGNKSNTVSTNEIATK